MAALLFSIKVPFLSKPLMQKKLPVPLRRAWLGLAAAGLLTTSTARAQMMGGGMGGGMGGRGGPPDDKRSAQPAAEPVGAQLIKIYAGERLRVLPTELKLAEELMPLYARYAKAVEKIMLDEGTWSARQPPANASPMERIGAQIDLANNRAAGWEEVLDAVRPLYAALDKPQRAIADARLVVSLEPSAWTLPPGPRSTPPSGAPPAR